MALFLHLAATNKQPEALQSDSGRLRVWGQEVLSRAYALHVLAR